METTATWDGKTQEWIVNCPTVRSQKYWITNGACHAHYAIVFAQTIVDGKNEGINIFMVPIRNHDLTAKPGVYIEDMGMKQDCNGVDNAKIIFSNVRIPREMLLDKICSMSPEGKFSHQVKKPRDRFLMVADRLLSGRICIASMSISTAKIGMIVSLKYSAQRKTVGPTGESDCPIIHYQLQQNALIPLLARVICMQYGLNFVKDRFHDYYVNGVGSHNELIRMCCIIKPMVTWTAQEIGNTARERCGGQGYLAVNRLAEILGFAHAGLTAEGDNRVLIQKVAKELTTDISKGVVQHPQMTMCPARELPKLTSIDDFDVLLNLTKFKQMTTATDLMTRMQKKIMDAGKPLFQVWMQEESDLIQATGVAYGENLMFQVCYDMVKSGAFGMVNQRLMEKVVMLYGLGLVENDLGWYLSKGVISAEVGKNLGECRSQYVKDIAPSAIDLADGFGVDELYAPIANDYIAYNEKPNRGEHGPLPKL